MKKTVAAAMALALLAAGWHPVLRGTAQALSSREYLELLRSSPEFSQADSEMNAAWKDLMAAAPDEAAKKAFRARQNAWLRSRDARAKELMSAGQTRGSAYAGITRKRTGELNALRETLTQGDPAGKSREEGLQTPFPSRSAAGSGPRPKLDKDGWEILN